MPKATFSTSNVRNSGTSFPTLKLENQGDYARIKLAEADPTYEWVHTLRKPRLSPVDGRLIMKTIEVGRDGNKEKKEVPDLEFVGTPICFGNDDVLSDRGVDPDHCVICKAAMDHPDMFDKPERKWAVHVFRYATKGNGTQAVEPLQFEVRVWRMSDNRYARVVSVLEEFAGAEGDPTKVDITLGPCNNVKFQNYEVQGSPRCMLAENPTKWAEAEQTFQGNHVDDLSPYCGRKADARYVKADIEEIVNKWRAAQKGAQPVAEPDFAGTLNSSMLDQAPSASAPSVPTSSLSDLDSTVGSSESAPEEKVEKEEAAPAMKGPTLSFDSLMDTIGVKSQ